MRRVIGLAIGLFAIGLLLNLLLAWVVAALAGDMRFDPFATASERKSRWAGEAGEDDALWLDRIWTSPGLRVRFLHEQGSRADWVIEHEAGWPLPALRGWVLPPETEGAPPRVRGAVHLRETLTMELYVGDLPTPAVTDSTTKILPWLPAWPGFVLNTLLFAAVLGGAMAVFVASRSALRRLRGRCPACGYDLRRNLKAGCSECGWRRTDAVAGVSLPSAALND